VLLIMQQALNSNGFPHKIVMVKSGANYAGIENINLLLMPAGLISFIEICQVKYLNNLIEQRIIGSRITVSAD
jgi:putative transposase